MTGVQTCALPIYEITPTEVSANFATCEGCHNDEEEKKKIAPQDVEHAAGGG